MLTRHQFDVLNALYKEPGVSQRNLAKNANMSLGSTNSALASLKENGLVGEDNAVSDKGMEALAPYRVKNAILMAAGMSSRFAPISYERPKGVLKVRGEILIERQIRQLKEAGIDDITIVVGYKKEEFFYLHEMFGAKIVFNPEYSKRNNNSTLYLVRDQLSNTYVCSSDNYFTQNPFETYVYSAYYSGVFFEGESPEYCFITKGKDNLIVGYEYPSHDSYGMLGHVYFDDAFSKKFVKFLEQDYDLPETAGKYWEDVYLDHVDELPMVMRPYPDGFIWEFDNLEELREFDPEFLENVDSNVFDNICGTFNCSREAISNIVPIKQGLTNLSCRFTLNGEEYIYRHPGAGTDQIISRESEAFSQAVAKELDIDDTFITEDPQTGWKISKFVHDAAELDYHNENQVKGALKLAKTLHESGKRSPWEFNVYEKAQEIVGMLDRAGAAKFKDFDQLKQLVATLYEQVCSDGVEKCLCHNDFYAPNFLVTDDRIRLIDWEYSAMSDYASDLGTFICCSDYTVEEAKHVIELYFGRTPSKEELRHCLSYVAISSFYWFVWALLKESQGEVVGEWLFMWYSGIKKFGEPALNLMD